MSRGALPWLRHGDPSGGDEQRSARIRQMRKRAAQELNPKMGCMGAEDPSRAFRPGLQPRVRCARMYLVCSQRCGGRLFRALFAEVELDPNGAYQDYRITQPGYICLNCGSPAFDLSEVPAAMEAEAEGDARPATTDILCPVCETLVQVDEGMECPNCGAPLEVTS